MEQATRAASSWARERIGRLALRESAMAIEVALDIALGNQAVVPGKAAGAASGVWGVWDGSWNRPAMPCHPINEPGGSLGGCGMGVKERARCLLLLFAFFYLGN